MFSISEGKVLGESALCKITKQIEDMILARGGYGTAKAIATNNHHRPLFKRLLDDELREDSIDAKARNAIINAARGFLKDIMSTRGRRKALLQRPSSLPMSSTTARAGPRCASSA
jgi:hypothetical protein